MVMMGDEIVQDASSDMPQAKGKPVKKRLQTERRKMQNRESQRKYRENIKARLEALEKEAEVARGQGSNQTSDQAMLESVSSTTNQNAMNPTSLTMPDFPVPGTEFPLDFDREILDGDFPLLDFSSPLNLDLMDQGVQMGDSLTRFYFNEVPDDFMQPSMIFDTTSSNGGNTSDHTAAFFQPNSFSNISTMGFIDDSESQQFPFPQEGPASSIQLHNQRKPAKQDRQGPNSAHSATDLIRLLRLNNNNENLSVLKTAISRGYNVRDVFLAGLSTLDYRDSMHRIPLPDPKKNTLTLVRTSTLQAYLSVATSLQIPIEELYLTTCPSPFYQPEAATTNEQCQSIISSYTTKLLLDLLPTPLQITIPHHPWLDLIPFPTFRERVLNLMSMTPPMIDMLELKGDIFMSDGIFCWRSSEKGGTGRPWEARNWEAEPWFLKKWWMVVGGEAGEMWVQTEWWRRMRGEEKVRMGWDER